MRHQFCLAISATVFGVGLFFSLFVLIVMTPDMNLNALWGLLIPLASFVYGVYWINRIDELLNITYEGWRR